MNKTVQFRIPRDLTLGDAPLPTGCDCSHMCNPSRIDRLLRKAYCLLVAFDIRR
jgi:hypothetical protein